MVGEQRGQDPASPRGTDSYDDLKMTHRILQGRSSAMKECFRSISYRIRVGIALAGVLALAAPIDAATVTNLQVFAQKGQAFVTFTEISGSGVTYRVYRSTSPITSLAGLTPVATLPQGSGLNRYTGQMFIIRDLGSPLPAQTGLLVWTASVSGGFYYAVTNSVDSALVPGVNVTTSPVNEIAAAVPGSVQLKAPYGEFGPGSHMVTEYFAWEDYATWDHGRWPYYGHRYNVLVPPAGLQPGMTYPLLLLLHPADVSGYREPPTGYGSLLGITVIPRDNNFQFSEPDPYTGTNHNWSFWYGWKRSDNVVINTTERRAVRYAQITRDDPKFQVDPNRIHVAGASLGGGGAMHLAYHFPQFFAAAAASIGWTDPTTTRGQLTYEEFLGQRVENGQLWDNWVDQRWLVENRSPLTPPIIYTFAKDDPILRATGYPPLLTATETQKNAYIAQWKNVGHHTFYLSGAASWARYKRNEAYPAFANSTNSDPVTVQEGQRNLNLDWSSSLNSHGTGTQIVDTSGTFSMSFKSLTTDATADITIRNAQAFRPIAGETVTWTNALPTGAAIESGTTTADANGLVTTRLQIRAAGNRITLRRPGGGVTAPAAPTNVRIIR
jgi:Putative esterase